MTCPAPDFVEESFLRNVKDTLSEQGLFIINLVSRSPAIKDMVVSRMKEVRLKNFINIVTILVYCFIYSFILFLYLSIYLSMNLIVNIF